jgi:hypothetical protein
MSMSALATLSRPTGATVTWRNISQMHASVNGNLERKKEEERENQRERG